MDNSLFGGAPAAAPTTDASGAQGGTALPSAQPAQLVSPDTATGTGSPVVAGAQAPQSGGSWLGDATSWLGNNIGSISKGVAPVIAGAGAANAIAGGMGALPQKGNIATIAAQQQQAAQPLLAAGQSLISQTDNGQLPASVQSELDQQLSQQINQIKAQYAQMGLSGSTMEQQAIQTAQNNYQGEVAAQLQSFMQQGVSDLNSANSDLSGSAGTYQNLANAQLQQQQGMSTAIANLLKAFSTGAGAKDNSVSVGG